MTRGLAALIASILLAACGSDMAFDEFCGAMLQKNIELQAKCGGAAQEGVAFLFRELSNDTCGEMSKAVAAGRARFERSEAEACLDRLSGADCGNLEAIGDEPCAAAIDGTVPAGGSCYQGVDCAGPAVCHFTNLACPGTCEVLSGAGAACEYPIDCLGDSSCVDGKCQPSAAAGEPCGSDPSLRQCKQGLYCQYETIAGGTCQQRKTSGGCDSSSECAAGYLCSESSACTRMRQVGEACTLHAHECVNLAYCDAGTCRLAPKPGEACSTAPTSTAERKSCLVWPCDAQTLKCPSLKEVGETCSGNDDCKSYECDGGKCVDSACREP